MNALNENQVKPLYMENQELCRSKATITKMGVSEIHKKHYRWIQLDETIFHPKGGGQPSDEGTINGVKVVHVHKLSLDKDRVDEFEILHCFDEAQELPFKIGEEVELVVDQAKRTFNSKMHTAGHILAETVKELFPVLEPYHGNHDPKDGYVKFRMKEEFDGSKEEIISKVQSRLQFNLDLDLPVLVIRSPSGMRAIQIGDHWMTCGGTHVHRLKEIGQVEVTDVSINKKEQIVTVKYRVLG
jgi:alanyl-tRNA synthetase